MDDRHGLEYPFVNYLGNDSLKMGIDEERKAGIRTFDDPRSTLLVGSSLPLSCLMPTRSDRSRGGVEVMRGNVSRP